MKFDVIVGNPPYNNDIYIDFVLMSKQLTRGQSQICMITPAKWQAKGGDKNELFRREIVPYMSDIVYYPDATDIFNISEPGGVAFYNVNIGTVYNTKNIKNVCYGNKYMASAFETHKNIILAPIHICRILDKINVDTNIKLEFKQSLYVSNTEYGEPIKTDNSVAIMSGKNIKGWLGLNKLRTTARIDEYKCITPHMLKGMCTMDNNGMVLGIPKLTYINPFQVHNGSYIAIKFAKTECEIKSFISYCETKLVAFLFYMGICGTSMSQEMWRFVPDPGAFDHIFTDEELYKKYNLTQEEIELIESVIKERK